LFPEQAGYVNYQSNFTPKEITKRTKEESRAQPTAKELVGAQQISCHAEQSHQINILVWPGTLTQPNKDKPTLTVGTLGDTLQNKPSQDERWAWLIQTESIYWLYIDWGSTSQAKQ
jgi:hypothetical protein